MNKKDLRSQILKEREKITKEDIVNRSNKIFEKIIAMDEFKKSKCIMIYVSFENEINTHPFIKYCLKIGKKVVTPVCNTKTKTLILGHTNTFPEGFNKTKYGILELDSMGISEVPLDEIDIIITPGLAFTVKGERLGYGGGYYDRLFEEKPLNTITIATIFNEFIVEYLPTEPFDKLVDFIVTEDKIIKV